METWLVLYDGDCGICKWLLARFLAWDRRERLRPVPIQGSQGGEALAGVGEEERLASWHLVSPAGERRSGGAAIPSLLELLPGGRALALPFARLPGATDRGYRWVARNRGRISKLVPAASKRRAARTVAEREARFG